MQILAHLYHQATPLWCSLQKIATVKIARLQIASSSLPLVLLATTGVIGDVSACVGYLRLEAVQFSLIEINFQGTTGACASRFNKNRREDCEPEPKHLRTGKAKLRIRHNNVIKPAKRPEPVNTQEVRLGLYLCDLSEMVAADRASRLRPSSFEGASAPLRVRWSCTYRTRCTWRA
jgi:hypothetical protein